MANTGRDNRKSKPTTKPQPKPVQPDAGPRPLSGRQQMHLDEQRQHLARLHAARSGRPATVLQRTVVAVQRPDNRPTTVGTGRGNAPSRPRYGAATAARQREKRRANRKKIDWPRTLLQGASFVFVIELIAAALFSPRLYLKQISFEGNATVATERLTNRLQLTPDSNLLLLLAQRKRLLAALKAEPTVEQATIRPVFPDGLQITITERTPFAAVKFDSDPVNWYTMDNHLVPFRVFPGMPEARLPLVTVAEETATTKPILGKTLNNPGLSDVGACLAWAKQQGEAFPVEKVTIDNAGKLCLNRAGGMTVLLGPGMDLTEKLNTLSLLLSKRTDLRGSAPTEIAAVNLYAYDAPALLPRRSPGVPPDSNAHTTAVP